MVEAAAVARPNGCLALLSHAGGVCHFQGTRKNFRSESWKRGSETRVPLLKPLTSIRWLLKGLKTKPSLPGTALAVGMDFESRVSGSGLGSGAGGAGAGEGAGGAGDGAGRGGCGGPARGGVGSGWRFQPIQLQQGVSAAIAAMARKRRCLRSRCMLEKQH